MMSLEVLRDRSVARALILFVIVTVGGGILALWQWRQTQIVQSHYHREVDTLKNYLRNVKKVPTVEEIRSLSRHWDYLRDQQKRLQEIMMKKESFSNVYEDVKRPLEFRERIAEACRKFNRKDVGFKSYSIDIPKEEELPTLKIELAFIEAILGLCSQNRIQNVGSISRLPKETLSESEQVSGYKYTIILDLQAKSDQLYRLLYDVADMSQLILVEGIRVEATEDHDLDLILKLTYVEVPLS